MLSKKTIKDVDFTGQTILLRADYNVPIKNGKITEDFRIRENLPTIKYLLEHGAKKIIIISHLGRPKGKPEPDLSLRPIAERLGELLKNVPVEFINQVSKKAVEDAVNSLPAGGVLVLENLRFSPGEEENSAQFADDLIKSTGAKLFVQDGFAVVHRAHASTTAIAKKIPAVAGLLLEKELEVLSAAMENPTRPLTVVIGGAKVDDKKDLIAEFSKLADKIVVGGKIAADGYTPPAGAAASGKIYVATDFAMDAAHHKLDLGPESTAHILELVGASKTVLWNGLLGQAEVPEFSVSSRALAEFLGQHPEISSIICGGDTTGFVRELQRKNPALHYSLISTGGGAALEFLSGLPLPGVEVLQNSKTSH